MFKTNNKVVFGLKGVAGLAPWKTSIALQVLIPFIVIGGLAFSSMLVSVWVTLDAQDDAEAINLAGSMRMQSYRIASQLQAFQAGKLSVAKAEEIMDQEVAAMDRKLYQSSVFEVAGGEDATQRAYQHVVELWVEQKRPMILAMHVDEYTEAVAEFADAINSLVFAIQIDSEEKNELLGMYQGISIVLSVMVLLYVGMRTDQNVVSPLKDLVQAAEHAERGDFSYRAYYEGLDEAGMLCQTFNKMSESLARSYAELEGRVEQRTRELLLSNRSIDFLYRVSRRLSNHQLDAKTSQEILDDLKDVLSISDVELFRASEPNSQIHFDLNGKVVSNKKKLGERRFALEDQGDYYGYLSVTVLPDDILLDWKNRLLATVVDLITSAMALQHQENINQRLMLFEERSVIARELHDSLAQSLSYLSLQLQRLNRLMEKDAGREAIRKTVSDMQEGLSTSYKHLRELLKTFRMKINAPTLQQALFAVVEEFKSYDENVEFLLEFEMDYSPLTPNEDIHVLQIIREAMNNAIKHAKAKHMVIHCHENKENKLIFSVIDDGVGMEDVSGREGHYGMQTMRERADILDGEFQVESSLGQGTKVTLLFQPLLWRESHG